MQIPEGNLDHLLGDGAAAVREWMDTNGAKWLEMNMQLLDVKRILGLSTYVSSAITTAATALAVVPAGTVFNYGGASAPTGYVLCDGTSYDGTTATYLALWGVLGTTYGGTGQASFKVPDIAGRTVVAKGAHADVSALNNNDGVAAANRTPKHRHGFTPAGTIAFSDPDILYAQSPNTEGLIGTGRTVESGQGATATFTGSAGNTTGDANNTDTSAFIVLNSIIKL